MPNVDWVTSYENGRRAAQAAIADEARVPRLRQIIFNLQDGDWTGLFTLSFAVACAQEPAKAWEQIPNPQHLSQPHQRAAALLAQTMAADCGEILDLMTDHPNLAELLCVLQKGLTDKRLWSDDSETRTTAFCELMEYTLHVIKAFEVQIQGPRPAEDDPEEITTDDPTLFDWLARRPDPDLWHQLASDMNYDLPQSDRVLAWIVAQPLCDRATAAAVFMMADGPGHVGQRLDDLRQDFDWSPALGEALITVCQRAAEGQYQRGDLAYGVFNHAALGAEMRELYRARTGAGAAAKDDRLPSPEQLFEVPLSGRAPASAYHVHSECVITKRKTAA